MKGDKRKKFKPRARVLVGNGGHQAIGHFLVQVKGLDIQPFGILVNHPNLDNKIRLSFLHSHLHSKAQETMSNGQIYWIRGYPIQKQGVFTQIIVTAWTPYNRISKSFWEYEKSNPYLFWGIPSNLNDEQNPNLVNNKKGEFCERIIMTGKCPSMSFSSDELINQEKSYIFWVQESILNESILKKYWKSGKVEKHKFQIIPHPILKVEEIRNQIKLELQIKQIKIQLDYLKEEIRLTKKALKKSEDLTQSEILETITKKYQKLFANYNETSSKKKNSITAEIKIGSSYTITKYKRINDEQVNYEYDEDKKSKAIKFTLINFIPHSCPRFNSKVKKNF